MNPLDGITRPKRRGGIPDAAGHADPATTASYDRHAWRGREAFEKMPEVEDVIEGDR